MTFKKSGRKYPDEVVFKSTGLVMSGKDAYTIVRGHCGILGLRKDAINNDMHNFY